VRISWQMYPFLATNLAGGISPSGEEAAVVLALQRDEPGDQLGAIACFELEEKSADIVADG
jgi:hypothetical protein